MSHLKVVHELFDYGRTEVFRIFTIANAKYFLYYFWERHSNTYFARKKERKKERGVVTKHL